MLPLRLRLTTARGEATARVVTVSTALFIHANCDKVQTKSQAASVIESSAFLVAENLQRKKKKKHRGANKTKGARHDKRLRHWRRPRTTSHEPDHAGAMERWGLRMSPGHPRDEWLTAVQREMPSKPNIGGHPELHEKSAQRNTSDTDSFPPPHRH